MNHVVLIGELVGKYTLPYAKINALEIKCNGVEYIVHTSEKMYEAIDLPDVETIAVKGHLYYFEGKMYVYADKITVLGA